MAIMGHQRRAACSRVFLGVVHGASCLGSVRRDRVSRFGTPVAQALGDFCGQAPRRDKEKASGLSRWLMRT